MRRQSFFTFFCMALLQCAGALSTAAECQLQLEIDHVDWRGGTRGGYDVFNSGEYAQTVHFRIRDLGEACSFFVGIGSGAPGEDRRNATFGGERLEYRIYDSISRRIVLKDVPAANQNEVIRGTFGSGEVVKELSFVILVPAQQVRGSGRYTDLLRLTAYEGTPENFVEKDSKTITFSIRVDEIAELSFTQPGAPFDSKAKAQKLDFERLAKGKTKGFDLRVRSNSGYQVLLESENGGVMKNTDPSIESTIPYSLEIEGQTVALTQGRKNALSRSKRVTDPQGDRHHVVVTVRDITGAVAGTYRDNIAVTVISDQ